MMATSAPNTKVASAGRRNSFTPGISSYIARNTGVYQPNMKKAINTAAIVKKRISRDHRRPRVRPIDKNDRHQRARVEQAHVLREEEVGHAEALVPGKAARAPEIDLAVHRAEQIGEYQREQMRVVQRAAPGLDVAEFRAGSSAAPAVR